MNIGIVRVLIEYSGTKRFNGTAFFINSNTLITAKHVIEEAISRGYGIYLSELPRGGKLPIPYDSIIQCEQNDIAIIKTDNNYNIPKILFTNNLKIGADIIIRGYHNEDGEISCYPKNISSYSNHKENIYEIGGYIAPGLSGSPIFLDNKICGIARAISRKKNLTYLIPIIEDCTNTIQQELDEEQKFQETLDVHNMIDNGYRFIVILSRKYINISKYEKSVASTLSHRDDFIIKILEIGDYEAFDIEDEIRNIFNLNEKKSIESELRNKIKNSDKKILLIIKDFEYIHKNIKNRIAKLLRHLIEDFTNFYLIIFGGKRLAGLVYENGNTSLFSNANDVVLWEEQKYSLSNEIRELTGNHPKLNSLCEHIKLDSIHEYKIYIKKHNILPLIFNIYEKEELCRYLEEKDLGNYQNVWNNNEFIRSLFWDNLLKIENGRLVWRSEFIRELGKELKCET